ncbi:MAG: methyl-accepting chemotaxis protein [Rhodoferax sp.]
MQNLRLASKLWLFTVCIVLGLAGVVGFAAWRSSSDRAESTQRLLALSERIQQARTWAGLIDVNVARSRAQLLVTEPALAQELEKAIAETRAQVNQAQKAVEAAATTEPERQQLQRVAQALTQVRAERDRVLAPLMQAAPTPAAAQGAQTPTAPDAAAAEPARPDRAALVAAFNAQVVPLYQAYQTSLRDFVGMLERQYAAVHEEFAQRARTTIAIGASLVAALVLALLVGTAWLIRTIRTPLVQATAAAQRIAQGDLSQPVVVDRGDEFGDLQRALADMIQALGQMVAQVRHSTDGIAGVSSEIAAGNQDLAQRTEQAASHLRNTAAGMGQLTHSVQSGADNARQASGLAAGASSVAERGGDVVRKVIATMEDINASSRKISDIITVIDGIAFQTNILALNAAVEAARAGEQGRGFAVVASEVRSLAQRSAEAAKEIKLLINASVEKVAAGTQLVSDAGSTMEDIVRSVRQVTEVIGSITAATGEQTGEIAGISGAIDELERMTQQNAQMVQQGNQAAQVLRQQADQLARAVSVFKTGALALPQHPPRDITPRAPALGQGSAPAALPRAAAAPGLAAPARPAQPARLASKPAPARISASPKPTPTPAPAAAKAVPKPAPAPALARPAPKPAPAPKAAPAPAGDDGFELF